MALLVVAGHAGAQSSDVATVPYDTIAAAPVDCAAAAVAFPANPVGFYRVMIAEDRSLLSCYPGDSDWTVESRAPQPLPDWSPSHVAYYAMDDTTGNQTAGTCPDCDFTPSGITLDTTSPAIGTGSVQFSASNQLQCANATCNELAGMTSATSWAWARFDTLPATANSIVYNLSGGNGSGGARVRHQGDDADIFRSQLRNGNTINNQSSSTIYGSENGVVGKWFFLVSTVDTVSEIHTLRVYDPALGLSETVSGSFSGAVGATDSDPIEIGDGSQNNSSWGGDIGAIGFIGSPLGQAEIDRLAYCGADGAGALGYKCLCDGLDPAQWFDWGYAKSLGQDPPDLSCNQATP